ncbi:adenylate kinase family protein [Mycoplasma phocimorsus]|uniref:Adenylate kinase n=1 Tax=Mycoplasma phocimorsus TaxID=3045839 RepID=A0AAJ1PSM6_9MOLU|nr:nucleoside monophosphate kinase [Mycoplasma phocimorsus]MDJ1645806.1 nucleoside monophosphate kinase [Mycoplasma phocimorsus]MDJ1646474.1 nucleoside monophosphate kinase [Mycoplasma phocimorsus]MDJ1646965.1 nucleoside monophosphate kinase [Mycoplasma phocimorsus]MDJ1647413.1 nucleoside monophosphate kinase [Mycoplasma phocimorsus]MDJ1648335.1 nucleoside monophosphate kinase [Mycoplasma phocimorsus]
MINLIFLGAPGVGKGTAANLLAQEIDAVHLSTGNLFRQEIASNSQLGLAIKQIVETGDYVSDDITNEVVFKKTFQLTKNKKSFILDGYPRTLNQSVYLSSLEQHGININFVILLIAPDDVILNRLSGRRTCPKCGRSYHIEFSPSKNGELCEKDNTKLIQRSDDSVDAIKTRLQIYKELTLPLVEYYKNNNKLVTIDSNQPVTDVIKNIRKVLDI